MRINVLDLSFCYEGSADYVFKNVSFSIDSDWRLGFCGRNGRGKTTFLRLLMGELEYSGAINCGGLSFDYFPFSVQNKEDLAIDVVKSIALGVDDWQILKETNKLRVDEGALYRVYSTLSLGEQTKILLASLFLRENCFLLIDEPTNHLSMEGRQIVGSYLSGKSGFILVSHDRSFLDSCTDHTLSINKCNIEITKGSFSNWFNQKQRIDAFEISKNEQLKGEILRLEKSALSAKQWSFMAEKSKFEPQKSGLSPDRGYLGKKSAKMMKHSKSIERRVNQSIEQKSKLVKNVENTPELRIFPIEFGSGMDINLSNVGIFYDNVSVVSGFDLSISCGERVAILGGNGSGKSSILKLIAGKNIPYCGGRNVNGRLKISYVCQDLVDLCGCIDDYALSYDIEPSLLKSILHKLDLSNKHFEMDIGELSMGQRKKVMLARSICERAHLYIWDEPLNYIDVYSRIQIENMLLDGNITLLFSEHDVSFNSKIATKTVNLDTQP